MRTFRFKNRYGREVNVAEEGATFLFGNPSMQYLGEVITTTEIKDVEKTRKILIEKYRYKTIDGKKKRIPVEVEEEEKYTEKEMVTTTRLDKESSPYPNNEDVEIGNGGQVRMQTVIDPNTGKKLGGREVLNKRKFQ